MFTIRNASSLIICAGGLGYLISTSVFFRRSYFTRTFVSGVNKLNNIY